MAELDVQVVATDHAVWQGKASSIRGRTVDGDMGILPGHAPVLAVLGEGDLVIEVSDGHTVTASVSGGFFSVDSNQVTIVADDADLTSNA